MRPAQGRVLRGREERQTLICRIGEGAAREAARSHPGDRARIMDLDAHRVGEEDIARELGQEERPAPVELMALFAGSATDLRRSVPAVAGLPCAARFHVVVVEAPAHLPPPLPVVPGSDDWHGLLDARVTRTGTQGWSVELSFLDPVEPSGVLSALSRAVVGARRQPAAGPVSRVCGAGAGLWRPGDPLANTVRRVEAILRTGEDGESSTGRGVAPPEGDPGEAVAAGPAPDGARSHRPGGTGEDDGATEGMVSPEGPQADGSPVGRAPGQAAVVAEPLYRPDPDGARWSRLGRPNAPGGLHFCEHDVPPVDERAVNPQGFDRAADGGRGRLRMWRGRLAVTVGETELFRVAEDGTVTDVQIAALRGLRQVDVAWGRHSGPLAAVRAVASLAAAGVPLTGKAPPAWSRCLGGRLHALLAEGRGADLSDELRREEHSVRLRRAALRAHGSHSRWAAMGERAGVPPQVEDEVSVLLVTHRPEMLGFGLRQVARQRSARLELVLALHGFGPDHPDAARALEEFRSSAVPLTVYEAEPSLPLGAVLNRAVRRARGTVLAKMDDDDWYGPEHVADLLMARRYAGADVVGGAPEFVYLQDLDLTVHQPRANERTAATLGGGTLLFDRRTWEEVGGFRPVACGEDSELLRGVARAGGRVYRTHGCNYVLRRAGRGHTWNVGAGHFLTGSEKRQRVGWHPSALLEPDPRDLPAPGRISHALVQGVPPVGDRRTRDHVGGEST